MRTFSFYRSEKQAGQAIVLIAMMMITLLAITGLAIDGGGMFLLYRDAQNAADAAALNAAFALCTGGDVNYAGISAARLNGFQNNDEDTFVSVNNPPSEGTNIGNGSFVEIIIEAEKPSYFIHLVYGDALNVRARTEVECQSGTMNTEPPFPLEYAIFGGSTTCNNTVQASGSTQNIFGSVHSNKDQKWSGSSSNIYGNLTTVTTVDGSTGNVNVYPEGSSTPVDPKSGQGASYTPMPALYDITHFQPTGIANQIALANGDIYVAYSCSGPTDAMDKSFLAAFQDATGQLRDGIYYSPCNIKINWDVSGGADPANITLVAAGEIQFSGRRHNIAPYYDGLLMFSNLDRNPSGSGGNQCSNAVIGVSGSNINWMGIMYAPNGLLEMSGSSNIGYGAIVADSVGLSGSYIEIHFDTSFIPTPADTPPAMRIIR